ncbi:melatonin receptor type 1C [Ceratina calcarata]|uniref:Melatonin receptor type 1C n=1 Tax=Ceratina calcarata TaxID=156304 RepID=A0AAJ7S346_9HYME|nr:melatonin receptor type 1C [Ceratina calcarata]
MDFWILLNESSTVDMQQSIRMKNPFDANLGRSTEWENVDTSKYPFPSEIWVIRSTWEVILKIASVLPIMVIGSLANGGLIYSVIKQKSLHTATNLLIANMCVADFGTCLIGPWMFLCYDFFQNYILGDVGCRLDGAFVHALTLVAVFNLSGISYNRVSAIVFNRSNKLSLRTTCIMLVFTWISAMVVAIPLICFRHYHERQWINYLETYCTEDTVLVYPYWHIFAGLSVWAPLGIMAICYSAILIKIDRYESQALRSKYPIVVKYKGRVAQVLALIVLVFILCRVPFTALIIRRAQLLKETSKAGQEETLYLLWYSSRYLILANAAINPLLYGCSSSSLRKELASCPATAWLIRKKKEHESKPCNVSHLNPQNVRDLQPRSPCAS